MRMLSLAIFGALCLGVMTCAQTANPLDDLHFVVAQQPSDDKSVPPRLIARSPGRILTPAVDTRLLSIPVEAQQHDWNGVAIIHAKPKPVLQVHTIRDPGPLIRSDSNRDVPSSPAPVAAIHHLQSLPPTVTTGEIPGAQPVSQTTNLTTTDHASIALVNAEIPIDSQPHRTNAPPEFDQWNVSNSKPIASDPIAPQENQLQTIRPRIRSGFNIAHPIAGEIPVVNSSSRSLSHAASLTAVDHSLIGNDLASNRTASSRMPDSMRPVATPQLAHAPDPVGAMPAPIRRALPLRIPAPLLELPMVNTDVGPIRQIKPSADSVDETSVDETDDSDAFDEAAFADLIVGTIPTSTRRVLQVAGQADELPTLNQPREIEPPVAIPMRSAPINKNVTLEQANGLVTLVATEVELRDVLRMIANYHKLNLVIGPYVKGPVTVNIQGARLDEVLDAILGVAGFHWHTSDNLLYVTGGEETSLDPRVQGRRLQVYPLNYVAASDIEVVVNGLLTPIGKSYSSSADSLDQLKTRELLVVEDNESGHLRVAQYLAQVDIPPRQVLVEAHVMQIDLSDEERHGVNLRALARVSGAKIIIDGNGFADEVAEGPSLAFRINGTDVAHLIEAIHSNTNSRTLASPKVSVVNRQTAKVQIGKRLPYAVATTTQTATIQNVQFLEVGIVLEVTPVITHDDNILMTVLPKVSGGTITENGFPEEDTTQVSTTVLMPDGSGLVIGGLIRETDLQAFAMVPKLGQIPVIKHLFTRRASETRRNELVVALVTHIMHGAEPVRQKECLDLREALPDHAASELHYSPEIRYSNH